MKKRISPVTFHYMIITAGFWSSFCVFVQYAAVFLQGAGYTNMELGLIMAVGNIVGAVLGPALGAWIDRNRNIRHAHVINVLLALQAVLLILLRVSPVKGIVCSVCFTLYIAIALPVNAVNLDLCVRLEHAKTDFNFGFARSMGSFSFDCSDIGIECEERTFMEHLITLKDGTKMRMSCVRLGVNHGVIYVDDDRDYPALYGEEIENLPIFLRDMNVNFTRYIDPGHIEVKTWERGVGKTLACGTGSSSAALITSRLKETEESIHVTVPGGELVIRIEGDTVYMEGPAEKVAEIEI